MFAFISLQHSTLNPMSIKSLRPSVSSKKSGLNLKQTKSECADPPETDYPHQWYKLKCRMPSKPHLTQIPMNKHSSPYKLTITNVTGINGPKKPNSVQYLSVCAYLVTDTMQVLGKASNYQCMEPVEHGKHEFTITFYFHSKIDRNCAKVKLVLRFQLLQFKNDIVQSKSILGVGVIDKPLIEDTVKNAALRRQVSELQAVSSKLLQTSSADAFYSYSIESRIELKPIIKFVGNQCMFSSQDQITGIFSSYLPDGDEEIGVCEQESVAINTKMLQIQLPNQFEDNVANSIKQLCSKLGIRNGTKNLQRKVVCGFHNEYQLVGPTTRKLDFVEREATGEWVVNVYEAIDQSELMRSVYYSTDKQTNGNSAFAVSLLYDLGEIEIEVAFYCFVPDLLSEGLKSISENMITGPGQGLVTNLIANSSKQLPTLIMEYETERMETARSRETEILDYPSSKHQLKSSHLANKKSRNSLDLRLSSRIIEEVEEERLNLEREKEELERMKTHHYVNYQEDFEKKLEAERAQLYQQQELLEHQYRQEVEIQIRRKIELEHQIAMMKERMAALEDADLRHPSHASNFMQTPPEFEAGHNDSLATGVFNFSNRVNPAYMLEKDKTVPVPQVRELLAQAHVNDRELIDSECQKYNQASKFTFLLSSVVWSSDLEPPNSFFICIRFFNFQQFRTDNIGYIDSGHQHHQLVKLSHHKYSHEDQTPSYSFTVDPSLFSSPELLQKDLVHFLCRNHAILDLFDARTHIYIGQINIKLGQLLRGTRSQVLIAKQFNIVHVTNQQNYGIVQLLIKNEMLECTNNVSLRDAKRERDVRKKIVSNRPLVISKESPEEAARLQNSLISKANSKNRQEHKIQRYKRTLAEKQAGKTPQFESMNDYDKGRMMAKIAEYKEKKMPQYLTKLYQNLLSEQKTINPYFGQAKTFIHEFTNISDSPSSFRVSIQQNSKHLTIVKDSNQWKYFVHTYGYTAPKIYECLNDQDCFHLGGGQTLPILFKYISFERKESSVCPSSEQETINIAIIKEENNWIIGGFCLNVEPHESVINHSYVQMLSNIRRLYQPGNHLVDIVLPALYSSSDASIPKSLYMTAEEAEAEWMSEYEILLKVRTPKIMNKLQFNMLLYEGEYCDQLRENWLIEIHSYEGVCTFSKSDQKTQFRICLPEHALVGAGKLSINSSHSWLVVEEEELVGARLARPGPLDLWCQLLAGCEVPEVQLTCTDQYHQLVYGWIIKIFPYVPKRA